MRCRYASLDTHLAPSQVIAAELPVFVFVCLGYDHVGTLPRLSHALRTMANIFLSQWQTCCAFSFCLMSADSELRPELWTS